MKIYGGFAGTETGLGQRDWQANPTILNGDLSGNDNANIDRTEATRSENSYHSVKIISKSTEVVLDGLIIRSGNANSGMHQENGSGSGLFVRTSVVTLRNCTFEKNTAYKSGAIYNDTSGTKLIVENCAFTENVAKWIGAIHVVGSPTFQFDSCVFDGNPGSGRCGALYISTAVNPTIGTVNNCVFVNNSNTQNGGAIWNQGNTFVYNSTFYGNSVGTTVQTIYRNMGILTLKNYIIWGSSGGGSVIDGPTTITYSIVQGNYAGTGNSAADPLFGNTANLKGGR